MKQLSLRSTLVVSVFALVGATADARVAAARAAAGPIAAPTGQQGITLVKIMSDPDWIGAAVKDACWSADGSAVLPR